jgi:protein TonB
MATAVASSAVVHVLAVAALLALRPATVTKAVVILPVSLVSLAGGGDGRELGGGGNAPAPASDPVPPPSPPPSVVEPTRAAAPIASHPKPVAKPRPAPETSRTVEPAKPTAEPKPATDPAAPTALAGIGSSRADGDGGGSGGGSGSGAGPASGPGAGLGFGAASPAYGVNPEPPYPLAARRMGLQGTVLLRVVVGADGSPVSVAVLQSSGHAMLDASAADTVRARWRFVPARRNGVPVEDTVQVPIRFRQTAG